MISIRANSGGFIPVEARGIIRASKEMNQYSREVTLSSDQPESRVVYYRPGKVPLWSIILFNGDLDLGDIRNEGLDMAALPSPKFSLGIYSLTPIGSQGVFSIPDKKHNRDGLLIKEYTWDGGPFSLERVKYRIEDVDPTVHMERDALIELLPVPTAPDALHLDSR